MISRRLLLKKSLILSALSPLAGEMSFASPSIKSRFKIGACDWSLGKASNIEAFEVAREVGLDGIMVDMGSADNNLRIRQPDVQDAYIRASKKSGIAISSLALGVYNRVPFHSDTRTVEWVSDAINAAKNLRVPVLLLAFFNASDLRNSPERKQAAVEILKKVMPLAEKNKVILGIESYLDAAEHLAIMEKVASKNLKVYYDFRNTADAGHDTVAEFKKLGKQNVCELHMKENGFLLGQGTVDWPAVSDMLYDIQYSGDRWMQIEGATPKGAEIIPSYKHNLAYLRSLFNK